MTTKNYLLALASFFLVGTVLGQNFTKITPQGAVGAYYSNNAWFDFDNDGDLDFLLTGEIAVNEFRTILYENTGNNNFRPALAPFNILPQYSESQIEFTSINNDDRIDVVLMGRKFGDRISLLRNGSTGFVDLGPLPDFGDANGHGTISAGDINNDGASDIFISGISGFINGNPQLSAYAYLKANETFTKSNSSFTGLYIADSKLADLDNDQDLDLIVCGADGEHPYQNTDIYLNDGLGNFSQLSTNLLKLQNPSIDLADYDNDNDLDILLTGLDANLTNKTKLYKNVNLSFIDVAITSDLNRTASGSAQWGDFDNDGDLDILITGDQVSKLAIFKNTGSNQFVEVSETAFEPQGLGTVSWGDCDSDGDLDILATGVNEASVPQLYILKNGIAIKNNAPTKPANLNVSMINSNSCSVSWDASTDDHSNSSSLTYNLSIKNTSNNEYLLHPYSDDLTGKRKRVELGNTWLNTAWKINNLADGTYAAKVQSIDGGYLASVWSDKKFIYAGLPAAPDNFKVTFSVIGGKFKFTWNDHSVNEEFFVIEKKTEGGDFVKFDSVSSNTLSCESAADPGRQHEFRIYSVNPNGKSEYSNIEQIVITESEYELESELTFYPNPSTKKIIIRSEQERNSSLPYQLLSTNGMIVSKGLLEFDSKGVSQLDIEFLESGFYLGKIKTIRGQKIIKFLKM